MPKLILASKSPQRKKLLKLLGLEFTVIPSTVEEKHGLEEMNCQTLVQHNAKVKARDVASRVKEGLVIGADSLVFIEPHTLIGKPKDLKAAKANLKKLMKHPCFVYTGLAVIDAATGKEIIDYDQTKIFMKPLSDEEIDRYHAQVNPLDKAGGFDIEGKGSLFIHRIEGCYFNVIGLPLSKLYRILKKFGVSALLLMLMIWTTGCASEYNLATKKQETLMYGVDKEMNIGSSISRQYEKSVELNHDVDINERVEKIMQRLVAVCDRKELVYTIKIIDDEKVINAVSLPGGYIYIYKGLIDASTSDDQLAGVIAHEIGHITAKHGMKRLQAMYGYAFLQIGAIASGDGQLASGVNAAFMSMFVEFSQADEFQADQLGVKYTKLAGYQPRGLAEFLKIMKDKQDKEPLRPFSYWRTHPYIPQRIANVNQTVAGKIDFRDYLNLTGEKDGY